MNSITDLIAKNGEDTVLQTLLPDGRVLTTILNTESGAGHEGNTHLFAANGVDGTTMPDCSSAAEHEIMVSILCA